MGHGAEVLPMGVLGHGEASIQTHAMRVNPLWGWVYGFDVVGVA